MATDGTVTEGPYPKSTEHLGGFAVVNLPSREEALEWAAKIAVACRCAQEVRELLPDPTVLEKLLVDGKVRAMRWGQQLHARPPRSADAGQATSVVPAVNQIEVHPYFRQSELLSVDAEHGIVPQAWSPIRGITFYRDGSHGSTLEDATIKEIAAAHGKTPAQVMLRWHLQQGRQAIPKWVTPSRIAENFDTFDFELTANQLAAIDALDTGVRSGPEPEQIPRENFGIRIPEA